ncbi:MAG: Teichoic-acid-transporting ATPase [Leptospirillum sp. Group II 'C75']|uniref:ABC transporter ATP-binding protein n=1 Tax=Leptospirillum sp. Group II 'CF-1' TaxID=1660083 RepID=UPI00029CCE08|nr:ABC transporter ATP-binding protein [Leptospirillum sp. Group II 'CF-1']AKS23119.1 sugar ABC transporter ATP-binding protein [Leptospirillum sp. Group II 'CF-1']EIJ75599.1 MAG: Teichoic-acid-transporting ATPase [Leptospirillum sp. Group II 'C75']
MRTYIKAENVCVDFPIFNAPHRSFKKNFLRVATGGRISSEARKGVSIRALDAIDFEVREGERLGLTGHNGSGKSTLLRVLAGVYEPTVGTIVVRGRIASLLDISIGMDFEASGLENIYIRGLLMGLPKQVIRSKIDEITAFSELGDYIEMPVRTYSSGMVMRLAFSIATSIEADILLMDEWLSVGDADFVKKAEDKLKSLISRTPILVMASHSPEILKEVCTKVMRLEGGRVL